MEHLEFLRKEFADMSAEAQWAVLPAKVVKDLQGLCVSPPNSSWSLVNNETLYLVPRKVM